MCLLIAQARPHAWQGDYPTANDLRELLAEPTAQNCARLWHAANGAPVAFALVDEANNLVFEVLPAVRTSALDAEIFTWGANCLRQRNAANGEQNTLDASCRVENIERSAWLEQFGFARRGVETLHLERALSEPIAPPQLPEGFLIRTVVGESEAEALAALHRAAFGTAHMTAEKRLVWMRAPHYDPALDLVAAAPSGEIAAYCFGRLDPDEMARTGRAVGWLDPLATHPRYQGRGLARALLLHGLQLLRARGMDYTALGTSNDNFGMQRAAFAAGFCIESKRAWFSKMI